jgi:hypothetical protein
MKDQKKNKKSNIKITKTTKKTNSLKRKRKTKKNRNICSPKSSNNTSGSCFTRKGLEKIARAWNKENYDKINFSKSTDEDTLWQMISEKMEQQNCDNELCWRNNNIIQKNYSKHDSDLDVFRPSAPKKWANNPREWLDTLNINDVLKQYEEKYPDFKYFGAVPIDFDKRLGFGTCVINEICNINVKKLYNQGYKKLGFVFNTDPHDKPGQHWIAMYSNLDKNEVNYWDSYGIKPSKEVKRLAERIISQGRQLGLKIKFNVNKYKHQFKNSECGVYSINFIVSQLDGNSFEDTVNNIIYDDKMWEKRRKYFVYENEI